MLSIGTRDLAAKPRRRQDLARIAQPLPIECVAELLHHVQVVIAEHAGHVLLLVDADAVLAGDRTAGVYTVAEDLARRVLRELRLSGNLLVVTNQRMEIAVAGVKHVTDRETTANRQLADALQHLRQLRS